MFKFEKNIIIFKIILIYFYIINMQNKLVLKIEIFLAKLFKINPSFENRYNYDLFNYNTQHDKAKITCIKHNNTFEYSPANHYALAKKEIRENIITSSGCKNCHQLNKGKNRYLKGKNNKPPNYNENDWKLILNFNDYFIHTNGTVFSKISNKVIKPYINAAGYLIITLYNIKSNQNFKKRVHILVAECFVPNLNTDLYNIVHHKDNDRTNPIYTNLEWINKSGNSLHANKHGNANRNNQRNEIIILDKNNNNIIKKCYSQKECCEFLKISNYSINNYFKDKLTKNLKNILTEKNWELKRNIFRPEITLKGVNTDIEVWKEILPDYPNYFISNFGNVKIGVHTGRSNKGCYLSSSPNSGQQGDHLSVGLNGKKYKRIHIHYLVLKYHLKVKYNIDNLIIDHLDDNKQNNYIGNLEWVNCHINNQRSMINKLWGKKDRKQKVSHIRYMKWNKDGLHKYLICMNINKLPITIYVDTKIEAIQKKKK